MLPQHSPPFSEGYHSIALPWLIFSNTHHLTVANIARLKFHIVALNKYLLKVLAGRLSVGGEGRQQRENQRDGSKC